MFSSRSLRRSSYQRCCRLMLILALQGCSLCLAVKGQAEDALAEIGRAVQLEPLNVHLLWNRCMFHYFSRQYDEAIALCMTALELDRTSAALHWTLGLILVQKRGYEKAVGKERRQFESAAGRRFFSVTLVTSTAPSVERRTRCKLSANWRNFRNNATFRRIGVA